jgi:hypothetical protein
MLLDQSSPSDIASVIWGFAKLGLPNAPGDMFLDAVCDNLLWTEMDQYSCQVGHYLIISKHQTFFYQVLHLLGGVVFKKILIF